MPSLTQLNPALKLRVTHRKNCYAAVQRKQYLERVAANPDIELLTERNGFATREKDAPEALAGRWGSPTKRSRRRGACSAGRRHVETSSTP